MTPDHPNVEALSEADAPACVALAATVEWPSTVEKWRSMLSLADAWGVRTRDGDLVGTVLFMRFDARHTMVAMMMVRPDLQKRGIGRALMEHGLARSGATVTTLFATEAGAKLYRPLGFESCGASQRFEGMPWPAEDRGAVALRPLEERDKDTLIALDERAQGARRMQLITKFLEDRREGVVFEERGHVSAFGVSSDENDARRIGPIVASRDDVAVAIAAHLAEGAERVLLDLEPGERALEAWAERAGLFRTVESPRLSKGLAGASVPPGDRRTSRAIAGRPFG